MTRHEQTCWIVGTDDIVLELAVDTGRHWFRQEFDAGAGRVCHTNGLAGLDADNMFDVLER